MHEIPFPVFFQVSWSLQICLHTQDRIASFSFAPVTLFPMLQLTTELELDEAELLCWITNVTSVTIQQLASYNFEFKIEADDIHKWNRLKIF